jgi:trehalose-phosphatase
MRNSELDAATSIGTPDLGGSMPLPWTTWPAERWWKLLRASKRSVLMLDYDGTLAPFNEQRMLATSYAGVAERLWRLVDVTSSRLVFVSGRPARELLAMLPPGIRTEIWGSHGRDHLRADGVYEVEPLEAAQSEALSWLMRSMQEKGFATAIESKPGSVAVHARGLTAAEVSDLMQIAERLFAEIKMTGVELLPFDGGVEIRGSGCTKGNAVERILQDEPSDVVAAYLGDDMTDEDAFRALEGRGLRVLVRDQLCASTADLWLRPPAELLAFLDSWVDLVRTGMGPG